MSERAYDTSDTKTLFLGTNDGLQKSITCAAELLKAGKLVAFPTETVYGLGADVTNPDAIAKVFEAKGRPSDNPMIVHVANLGGIETCAEMDDRVRLLVNAFMPGPLTLVLPSKESVPLIARAGLPTVALRIPEHPVALELIKHVGPLVAPSANISGRPSPTTARHVIDDLAGRIAAVLDGGLCRVGIESTVLDLTQSVPVILRPGVITQLEIEGVLKDKVLLSEEGNESALEMEEAVKKDIPRSPGTKYRHYAPGIPIRLVIDQSIPEVRSSGQLVLTTERHKDRFREREVMVLSEAMLYEQFRRAEKAGYEGILIYAQPGELSEGLLNRVKKAEEE